MAVKRTIDVCLVSGFVGIMLGAAPYAVLRLKGYDLTRPASSAEASEKGTGSCSGGPPMGNKPRPKRDLTALVQKLNLLTGDIGITLSAEQAAAVDDCLRDVEKSAKMSDDEAQAKQEQLMALLDADQKAHLKAIELPQPAFRGGPGAAICPLTGQPKPARPGSGPPEAVDENQNPFQQASEGKALKSLHERLAAKEAAPLAETPKDPPPQAGTPEAAPTKAEMPKAQPPEADASKSSAASS
jgi:hypothetical protein